MKEKKHIKKILVIVQKIFFISVYFIISFKVYSINPLSKNINSINAGAVLYKDICSNCHGMSGQGKSNGFFYSPNLKVFNKGYEGFIKILINDYGRMPAWGGKSKLTNRQLNQLAAYLEEISTNKKGWK